MNLNSTIGELGGQILVWILGAITVVGLIQYVKALLPKVPGWIWAIACVCLAVGYAFAPDFIRLAAGIVAVSQLGYEKLFKPINQVLGDESRPIGFKKDQ